MTARLKRVGIFGEGIRSKSDIVTRQRRLNCYLEVRRDQDKSSIVCYGTPGLGLQFNASTPLNLPARGMIGNDSALYLCSNNLVKSLSATGVTLAQGNIGSIAGLVGMALNPTQVMIVDGSAGYVMNPTTGVVTAAGGAFPLGAKTVTYCNGFFVAEAPGTNQFFVSALNDGTTWNGLSFAAAVQAIDGIKAVDTLGGLLIIFSAGHLEFWQNVGSTPEPFQYITNSAAMYGIEAVASRAHVGDAMYFIAHTNGGSFQNTAGSFQVAQIRGYAVSIVSTPDVDNILQTMARQSGITDATAFSYQQDSHTFVQFNFPAANRSLLFDTSEKLWSEVQSGIPSGYASRHLGNLAAGAFNQTFIGDYTNGNIYSPDPTIFTDNGNVIVRELVTKTGVEDFNTFRIGSAYFDMQTGVGLSSPTAQGYDPVVEFSIARDGRDFSAPRLIRLGMQGQYTTRVIIRRCGRARTASLKLRTTDPFPWVITSGAMMTSMRKSRRAA